MIMYYSENSEMETQRNNGEHRARFIGGVGGEGVFVCFYVYKNCLKIAKICKSMCSPMKINGIFSL